ncbi:MULTISPECIES: hypothetical protein [Chryseobacterium]|uniref:DUF2489 domain-containing protein n=1 Tax=Chryseobacterium camelliae TaxID=1265445 RepID=A0ABU0THH3_9FLAO|nr:MULTISPECIES: hypothetical protein [Chryseobacterium]MDT3405766.1 hypothetical protein [Pseudacidovorax intermedius]MDQ1096426.1 hypothetical protein [Chryseobacterium camelliae]MDQ1100367.1 hypothetical protein [Chryseobacterium sp. SORGH_AS_1048]MDR6087708.1 hypothetical protein [Chryseobacterium sp. SORGH_AS_0909]MDR6132083.1 hypothetical protein [Chryseobacterium sp. SORGH_AS_1175]
MNGLDALRRNRLIKKLRSNAIAITTGQIDVHAGYFKMNYLLGRIENIKALEDIDLSIFKKYYLEIQFHPIGQERKLYRKDFLERLDRKLKAVDERYSDLLHEKCLEIIEKYKDIKDLCQGI